MTCARCADLEEQVAYLTQELRQQVTIDQLAELRARFGLTPQEAHLLGALYAKPGRTLTHGAIAAQLPSHRSAERMGDDQLAKVVVSRVRKKLGREAIETVFGCGWRLTAAGRALVDGSPQAMAA